jgi:hypothetical protein
MVIILLENVAPASIQMVVNFRRMKLLALIIFTTLTFPLAAQRIISGEVRMKNDSVTLPGINVTEKGTENVVYSDTDGKFSITCKSANPTLEFSFIGLKTIQLTPGNEYLVVYLEEDEEQMKEKVRFGMYPSYTSIGFNSGINYTPVGARVKNALPVLFGIKVLTTSEATFRTDLNDNEFLDLRIRKDQLINFHTGFRCLNLNLAYLKRHISREQNTWNTEEFTVVPELQFDSFIFQVGYGRQSYNDIETLSSNEGFVFGIEYFLSYAGFTATAKKWSNYWQTEFRFTKGFKKSDFELAARFETLDNYRELDLVVSYAIHY